PISEHGLEPVVGQFFDRRGRYRPSIDVREREVSFPAVSQDSHAIRRHVDKMLVLDALGRIVRQLTARWTIVYDGPLDVTENVGWKAFANERPGVQVRDLPCGT